MVEPAERPIHVIDIDPKTREFVVNNEELCAILLRPEVQEERQQEEIKGDWSENRENKQCRVIKSCGLVIWKRAYLAHAIMLTRAAAWCSRSFTDC